MHALTSCSRWQLALHAWVTGMAGALLVLVLLVVLGGGVDHRPAPAPEWWRAVSALAVAPVLETALLVGLASWLLDRGPGLMRRAALVALPLALLHLLNSWQNMLVTLPVFWIQAALYLELRRRGHDLLTAATPVVGVHILHNASGLLVAALLAHLPAAAG